MRRLGMPTFDDRGRGGSSSEFAQRSPISHARLPAQIRRPELSGSQSFADLLERELTELRPIARYMDHRHGSLYEA